MKLPKIRELWEAIKALIKGPYTSKFPRIASVPPKGFRGRPKYHQDDCVGCKACVEVCPARAIEVEDIITGKNKGIRRLTHRYDICIFCGQCEKACITEKGIILSDEYDLALEDRAKAFDVAEKQLAFCERCGEIAGAIDHIQWTAEKLGPLAFANPNTILMAHKELGLLPYDPGADEPGIKRADHLKLLCVKCRREAIFGEQW